MTDFLKDFLIENKDLLSEEPNNTDYQKLFDNWAEYTWFEPAFINEDKKEDFNLLYSLFKSGISLDLILSEMDSIPPRMFTYIEGKIDLSKYHIYSIKEAAFGHNWVCKLQGIILPNSLESISDLAFDLCKQLEYIKFNDGLKTIGNASFGHCDSLTEIYLPDSLVDIDFGAFSYCGNLKKVSIPQRFEDQLTDIFYDDLKGSFRKGYDPILKRKIDFELR